MKEKAEWALESIKEENNSIDNKVENVYKLKEELLNKENTHRKELQVVSRPEKKRKTSGNEGYGNLTTDELRKKRGQSTPRRSESSKDGNNRSGGEVEKLTPIQVDNISTIKDKRNKKSMYDLDSFDVTPFNKSMYNNVERIPDFCNFEYKLPDCPKREDTRYQEYLICK